MQLDNRQLLQQEQYQWEEYKAEQQLETTTFQVHLELANNIQSPSLLTTNCTLVLQNYEMNTIFVHQ